MVRAGVQDARPEIAKQVMEVTGAQETALNDQSKRLTAIESLLNKVVIKFGLDEGGEEVSKPYLTA